ncbi:MAG: response regulator transcription factor [bacterium]|nr:response regulator transcription factor [bacterium]
MLVVEDDASLRLVLADNLEEEGYRVSSTASGVEARARLLGEGAERLAADLIILDIMLPDVDGYSLCRELRDRRLEAPILMLTARTLEDDLVRGFDAGADDFLTKPYRLRELLARVRALLRRRAGPPAETFRFGGFHLDTRARSVHDSAGAPVDLTRTELDLLALFLRHEGEALTRDRILDEVWGPSVVIDARTVDNFVSSLKKKLAWSPASNFQFRTLRGVGYRLEVEAIRK